MSRDRLFELYRKFTDDHMYLKEKAFTALSAALNLYEKEGQDIQVVHDKLDFGLRLIYTLWENDNVRKQE